MIVLVMANEKTSSSNLKSTDMIVGMNCSFLEQGIYIGVGTDY